MAENKDNELEALRKEVDSLKADIEELKRFLIPSCQEQSDAPDMVGHVEKMHNMHSDPSLMTIMDRLKNKCGESGSSGCISYVGVFASGGRQYEYRRPAFPDRQRHRSDRFKLYRQSGQNEAAYGFAEAAYDRRTACKSLWLQHHGAGLSSPECTCCR